MFQTKAAFTRTYNKQIHLTPYSTGVVAKKRRGGGGGDELDMLGAEEGDGVVEEEEEEVDDDIDIDTMIKVGTFTMCHLNFLTNK